MAGDIRKNRVSQAIIRFLGTLMISDYGGTDLAMITIQKVKVTQDLRQAQIFYTFLGNKKVAVMQDKLENETRQIRHKLAGHLKHLKFVPEIKFVYDKTADEILRVQKILDEHKNEVQENEN
jgi:ribosome-binding factor A